jgi:hypothetical protein
MLRKLQETDGNSKSVSPPFAVMVSIYQLIFINQLIEKRSSINRY